MKRHILYIALLAFLASPCLAGEDGGTTSPFSFGTGPRELAMGGSVLAESDAASSPFWNPSRLATIERFSLTGLHSRLFFPGNVYQYLGIAVPTLDQGGFGLGIFRQGIDGIEKRDNANQYLDEIRDNQLRLYLAHGRSFSEYNFGLAATLEYHSLDGLTATSSPGLDLSVSRRFSVERWWLRKISAAINTRNLLRPGIKLADTKYHYKTEFKTGLSFDLKPTFSTNHRLLISTGLTKKISASINLAFGLEYSLMNILSLRGGIAGKKLSAGIGLKYGAFGFDYAIVDRDFGSIHMISLTSFFGRTKSERLSERVRKRDIKFRSAMTDLFSERNSAMIEELIMSGTQNLNASEFTEAIGDLDRALFLARSTGYDTTIIVDLISRAKGEHALILGQQQYELYLDSAQIYSYRQDFIAAKCFANQALLIKPESDTAMSILSRADRAMTESTARDKMIAIKLESVDSAMAIDNYKQALLIIKSLEEIAPENEGVLLRSIKIDYELLKLKFENPDWYSEGQPEYTQAQFTNDTIAAKAADTLAVKPKVVGGALGLPAKVSINDLSSQLIKEVDGIYKTAKKLFEEGQLNKAVEIWERVDQLAPGFKSVREYLVKAYTFVGANYYAQKKRENALNAWKKVVRLDPENTEVHGYIQRTKNEISKLKVLSYEE